MSTLHTKTRARVARQTTLGVRGRAKRTGSVRARLRAAMDARGAHVVCVCVCRGPVWHAKMW